MNLSLLLKKLLSFFILILFIYLVQAQEERLRPFWGSAKDFKGKTLIVNCFVSADHKDWTTDEKNEILTKESKSVEWAKEQALQWKITGLDFTTINLGLEHDIKLNEIKKSTDPNANSRHKVAWVPLVLHAANIPIVSNFYDSVKKANNADNVVVVIFARETGHSFAEPSHDNNKNGERFLEGVVVYRINDYDGSEMRAGTIIHEVLHLFGAWDMYVTKKKTADAKTNAINIFAPRTIMLGHAILPFHELSAINIDPLTAWRIGWSNQYWPWFAAFGPKKAAQQNTDTEDPSDEPYK